MEKIICPCICEYENRDKTYKAHIYVKIKYNSSKLAIISEICSVEDGEHFSSSSDGESMRKIAATNVKYVEKWTAEMFSKLCDVWEEWSFNDRKPYCEHQRKLRWNIAAEEERTIYHYRLIENYYVKQRKGKEHLVPKEYRDMFSELPFLFDSPIELTGEMSKFYECRKRGTEDREPISTEKLGELKNYRWMECDGTFHEAHPDGLLDRDCPVCGHKYGERKFHEVPESVIEWLFSLPDSKIIPDRFGMDCLTDQHI